jgi:hypothetical protein
MLGLRVSEEEYGQMAFGRDVTIELVIASEEIEEFIAEYPRDPLPPDIPKN